MDDLEQYILEYHWWHCYTEQEVATKLREIASSLTGQKGPGLKGE